MLPGGHEREQRDQVGRVPPRRVDEAGSGGRAARATATRGRRSRRGRGSAGRPGTRPTAAPCPARAPGCRGRRGSAPARARSCASATSSRTAGSDSVNCSARGCSLIPRAPASRQRRASATASLCGSTRQNATQRGRPSRPPRPITTSLAGRVAVGLVHREHDARAAPARASALEQLLRRLLEAVGIVVPDVRVGVVEVEFAVSAAARSHHGRRMPSTSSIGGAPYRALARWPILAQCTSAASASGSRPSATTSRATLQLPSEGYRSRTTDFLNAHERDFLALTDAEVPWLDGAAARPSTTSSSPSRRRHIVMVIELESLGMFDEPNPALGRGALARRRRARPPPRRPRPRPARSRARPRWPARRPRPRPRSAWMNPWPTSTPTTSLAARARSSTVAPPRDAIGRQRVDERAGRGRPPPARARPARRRARAAPRRRPSRPPASGSPGPAGGRRPCGPSRAGPPPTGARPARRPRTRLAPISSVRLRRSSSAKPAVRWNASCGSRAAVAVPAVDAEQMRDRVAGSAGPPSSGLRSTSVSLPSSPRCTSRASSTRSSPRPRR